MALIAGAVLLPILANICYTLGWIVELSARGLFPGLPRWFGPALFTVGLAFSCFLVSLPALFWMTVLFFQGLGLLL